MSPQWKLAVRTAALFVVAVLSAWLAVGLSFDKAGAVAVVTAVIQLAVELLGPTSDAGVKWEPKP